MTSAKERLYLQFVTDARSAGLATAFDVCRFRDGRLVGTDPLFDRLHGQGWWGMAIQGVEDEALKVRLIGDLLAGLRLGWQSAGGTLLRDPQQAVVDLWRKDTKWEASKDQLLGLTAGLLAVYEATTHESLRQGVRDVLRPMNDNLARHWWFLYNEGAKRGYDSPNYCQVHAWGLAAAFSHILGRRQFSLLEPVFRLVGRLLLQANLRMMVGVKARGYWWQNIRWLKKFEWYGDYFRAGMFDFNLNLCFYECYIRGTLSKRDARWVCRLLERPEVRACRNFNLAALYLHLASRWGLPTNGEVLQDYAQLLEVDDYLHPSTVPPNEARVGSPWLGAGAYGERPLFSHEVYDYDLLVGNPRPTPPSEAGAWDSLVKLSRLRPVYVNCGLSWLARRALLRTR